MADGIVYRQNQVGPATHALVIGVGAYPHLPEGGGRTTPYNDGMMQLSSAAVSARGFADWLMPTAPPGAQGQDGYHDPKRPLASVRMLLSEAAPGPIETPSGRVQPLPATMQNAEDTIRGWFADLDASEDDLAILYFAGHGVTAGLDEQALLLEDFGANDLDAFKASVRFSRLHLGMDRAKARDQVFFVDACRSYSKEFAATFGGAGQAVIPPSAFTPKRSRLRACPIFYATTLGASAYGRPGEMTIFTAALIDALKGGGGDNPDGMSWRIDTSTLQRALDYLVKRTCDRENLDRAQNSCGNNVTTVSLSVLRGVPCVPVTLSCRPSQHDERAVFKWMGGNRTWGAKDRDPLIPVGMQDFTIDLPGGVQVGPVRYEVRPSYRTFCVEIL